MTTITIERELLEQVLNALLLPCDRWNGVQSRIVKEASDAVLSALAAPATAPDKQLRKDAERYRTALKAMTQTEYCDCGCPKAEKPILLMPAHYYALALEALKGAP